MNYRCLILVLLSILLDVGHPRVLVLTEHLKVVLNWARPFLLHTLLRVVSTRTYLTGAQPVRTATNLALLLRFMLSPAILIKLSLHRKDRQF